MITHDGIDILNAARKILERADKDAMAASYEAPTSIAGEEVARAMDLGRVAEAADRAADAIFNFLNVAHNFGHVPMSEEQLYGRKLNQEVEA